MPETPMDEDHRVVLGKYDIRSPGKATRMKAESQSCMVKATPQQDLGLCIPCANAAHIERALRWARKSIMHLAQLAQNRPPTISKSMP